jgi:hypothetical protein
MSTVTDLPPLWVPLPELPRWLQDMHGLTEAEAWDVLVYLRGWSFHFRVADDDESLTTWNGWDVKDWKIGRAHWEEDPPDIDYPLKVSWDAVARAVRQRREREPQALPPPAPNLPQVATADSPVPASEIPTKKRLPPFDPREAKALLAAKKIGGTWADAPIEEESRAFLKQHFNGVPNDLHRQIRRELWRDNRPGPRSKPKQNAAE